MTRTFRWILSVGCMLFLFLLVTAAQAKVSPEEAQKLKDGTLMPMGGDAKPNADGTIPAWTGGITKENWPAGYKPGMRHIDPFPGEQPLFTITAANVSQYEDKLSPGQIAMFKRYPNTWKMNVYPTHRTASYPHRIYEMAYKNALNAELVHDGNGIDGCAEAIPFPIAKNGLEAIWNHLTRYRGPTLHRTYASIAPTAGGSYTVVTVEEKIYFIYSSPGATIQSIKNRLFYFLQTVVAPPRLAGQILLLHETLDQVKEKRKAWIYNPGQRRVRRAPNVAYDNPGTASDGQRTADQLDMFNGAPDRYTWELLGKKEMYIPYNAYKIHDKNMTFKQFIQPGHVNPDFLRYELHRVWVVDAKLKKGTRHVYHRRTFYLDEDSWSIVAADQYDARMQIWRVSECHQINYYDQPLLGATAEIHYDLQNGRYLALGMTNEGPAWRFGEKYTLDMFTPAAIRRLGRR